MFDKLLSRLSFNPSHLDDFLAYSNKLQKEKALKRLSVYLIAAGIVFMIFSILNATEKSVLYSDDNIINGIRTKDDILSQWDNNQSDIAEIYSKFGVKRQDIANLTNTPNTYLSPTSSGNYWTIMRHIDNSSLTGNNTGQGINLLINNKLVIMQPLGSLTDSNKQVEAFKGRNSTTGQPFWVLSETGGYVQIGRKIAKEDLATPKVIIKKSYILASARSGGSEIIYEYRNITPDSLAQDVQIKDQIDPANYSSIDSTDNTKFDSDGNLTINLGNLRYEQFSKKVVVRLNPNSTELPTENMCSAFSVSAANAGLLRSHIATDSCWLASPEQSSSPQDQITPSLSLTANIFVQQSDQPYGSTSAVSAGDTVEYKLIIDNTSDKPIKNFLLPHYVGDLLDYGDVRSDELADQNAVFNPRTKEIVWNSMEIPAKSTTTKDFKLYLKNTLPSTNRPSLINFSYDCRINTQNGNSISVPVNCPRVKKLENIPSLSGSSALAIGVTALAAATLLYIRSEVLTKEARKVKKTYQQKNHG